MLAYKFGSVARPIFSKSSTIPAAIEDKISEQACHERLVVNVVEPSRRVTRAPRSANPNTAPFLQVCARHFY